MVKYRLSVGTLMRGQDGAAEETKKPTSGLSALFEEPKENDRNNKK